MKLSTKLFAILTALSLAIVSCTIGYAEPEESSSIPSSVTLDALIYSQRPDGIVFENPKSTELVCGMVADKLAEDGTPTLTEKGWYLYDTESPMIDSAEKSSKNKDFSADKSFAFNYSKFYYWFHQASENPLGDILNTAMEIAIGEGDQTQKLYAVALAEQAMQLASSPSAAGYDKSVSYDELQKGGKAYPATELAFSINNLLQTLYSATQNGTKLSSVASNDLEKLFDQLKAEYDKSKDKENFCSDKITELTEIGIYDMRLNIKINYPIELTADGEEVELGDKTKGYTYSFESSAFYPIEGDGFYTDDVLYEPLFTMTFESNFVYHGGEIFSVSGNDDIWVFINDTLVLDMGGTHSVLRGDIELDEVAKELGIKQGDTCKLNFFYANRQSVSSALSISTTILPVEADYDTAANRSEVQGFWQSNGRIIGIVAVAAGILIILYFFATKNKSKNEQKSRRGQRHSTRKRASKAEDKEKPKSLDDVKSLDELYGYDLDEGDKNEDESEVKRESKKDEKAAVEEDGEDEIAFDLAGSIYDDSDISFLLDDLPKVDTDDNDD